MRPFSICKIFHLLVLIVVLATTPTCLLSRMQIVEVPIQSLKSCLVLNRYLHCRVILPALYPQNLKGKLKVKSCEL